MEPTFCIKCWSDIKVEELHFDLIIPCFNPEKGWEKPFVQNIKELKKAFDSGFHGSFKVILINDGSAVHFTGREYEFIINSGISVQIITNELNRGKGYSIRRAVSLSSSEYCIYTDLDIPFGNDSILQILRSLENGYDIVVGSRSKLQYFQQASFTRKIISKTLMKFNKHILKMPFEDTQAGIKGFNLKGKTIFLSTTINRFLFDLEFLKMACDMPYIKIRNIQVSNHSALHLTSFSFRTVTREAINFLRILAKSKYATSPKENFTWDRFGRI